MKVERGGRRENAEGKASKAGEVGEASCKDVWGKPSAWCDYSGIVNGKTVGITIFGHPSNFRQSYFHARAYGLISANPFGTAAYTGDKTKDGSYTIPKGQSLTLRYALYVHPGDVKEGKVAEMYRKWIAATP
jgi:hypothetical protein